MKTRKLNHYGSSVGCEVYDIDLNSDDEILELGKLVADQCVVYVNQKIDTRRLYQIQHQWGQDSRPIVQEYLSTGRLEGKHWREVLLNMMYITKDIDKDLTGAVLNVTYLKDEKGKPRGLFSQGELDWHSDQVSYDDAQRVIGLQSISDSQNSQTQFLCTYDAYESLSSDMKNMVKELYVRHKWSDAVAVGADKDQLDLVRYNYVPIDGLESRLYSETATGRPGLKLTLHSFDGFVGMSNTESKKIIDEIYKAAFKEEYIYTHHWQDGQIVFMDQEITIHKRPSRVEDSPNRKMSRVITYLNYLFPNQKIANSLRLNERLISHDEFIKIVDNNRRNEYAR